LQIESPASLQAERLRWLQAHQPPGAEQSCRQVQVRAMERDPADAEEKRQRIRKRIGHQSLNGSKQQ
jgi:hypothetical protein